MVKVILWVVALLVIWLAVQGLLMAMLGGLARFIDARGKRKREQGAWFTTLERVGCGSLALLFLLSAIGSLAHCS